MRKDNPAIYACSKGKGGIHAWNITDAGATCQKCKLELGHDDARDLFFGAEISRTDGQLEREK